MSKNRLDEIIAREIQSAKQTPSVKDVTAMLTGKDNNSIAKPGKKSTDPKRSAKIAALKAKRAGKGTIDGNEILEQIKADRNKTAENSGTITSNGKVLASAKGSEPSETDQPVKENLTQQESFLKQIQDYNDFIVQNNLDAEMVNVDRDYDFSAFTSPEDWTVESERLADRLSDRKIEIKQNEDAGEFAGMELENGAPSSEAVDNMSDEQYADYEKKYLSPSTDAPDPTDPGSDTTNTNKISPELKALKLKNKADNVGITIPDDVGSRVGDNMREKPWTAEELAYPGGRDFHYPNFGKYIPPATLTDEEIGSIPKEPSIDGNGNTGILDSARDFVVDGLGSIVSGVTEGRDARRDRRYVPKDVWLKETERLEKEARAEVPKEVAKAEVEVSEPNVDESKSAPMDLKSLAMNSLPAPVKYGLENALEAVKSANKVVDQGQPLNAVQDAGRGGANGLAETTGDVLDLGGLVPNRVSDMAHNSADWWKDQYEIPDSEAGNIGTKLGTEAVSAAGGGAIGKVAGKVYKNLKHGGESLRKRATVAAADAEKTAKIYGQTPLEAAITRQKAYENLTSVPPRHSYGKAIIGNAQPTSGSVRIDPIPYGHPMGKEDLLTKALREKNHLDGKYTDGRSMTGIDLIDPVGKGNLEYPTPTRLFDTALHNAKRKLDSRAMLKRNDTELNDLYSQGTPLDKALKMRQDRWDQIPDTARDAGLLMGLGVAQ